MQITTGKIESPQKVLVYGTEGIGKSTFAAAFPNPLFIDTEGSTKHLDVRRLPTPESWTMLLEEVRFVVMNPSECSTLVIDTADWAEQLCVSHVCAVAQKNGIEDFGYGKGFTYLAEEFGKLLNLLTEAIDKGVNVVLTAHAQIKKFEQPDEMAAYDRWELKLQKKTAPLVKEWADMVLFANYETFAVKDSQTGKVTAQGGKRVMHTTHAAAWDAKNRSGLDDKLDFDFAAIASAIPVNAPAPAPKPVADKPATEAAPVADTSAPVVFADREGESTVPDVPAHLAELYQLMDAADVTEAEVRAAVHDRGYYPESTAIDKYDPDFVKGNLVGAWPKVLGVINGLKQTSMAECEAENG